jgi:HAMP domain-containing protein
MESRHAQVGNPQARRRSLLRSAAAVGAAIALVLATAHALRTNEPLSSRVAATAAAAVSATVPALTPPIPEYSGTQGHFTDAPEEQSPTF